MTADEPQGTTIYVLHDDRASVAEKIKACDEVAGTGEANGPVIALLIEALRHRGRLRPHVIKALEAIGPDALDALVSALSDGDPAAPARRRMRFRRCPARHLPS